MSLFISMLCFSPLSHSAQMVYPQPALLPVGATAVLPPWAGLPFTIALAPASLPAVPAELLPTLLQSLLPATGWPGPVESLEFRGESHLPAAGELPARRLLRYQQLLGDAELEGMGVLVVMDASGIRSLSGALQNEAEILNRRNWKEFPDAQQTTAVLRTEKEGLRHAWRLEMPTEILWLDAESGDVLERRSWIHAASALGVAFVPDPLGELEESHFAVDRPVDGFWYLRQSGSLIVLPGGADGLYQPLALPQNTADWADFRAFGTPAVEDLQAPGYNPHFAQINLYYHLSEDLHAWSQWGGQHPGEIIAWSAHPDPCGRGNADGACAWPGELRFGLGEATKGGSGAFHSALDGSLISHELAHLLLNQQQSLSGGVLDPSVEEGIADYFATSRHGLNSIGAWSWADPAEGMPRTLNEADAFPLAWLQGNGEAHANGQILARALLNSRSELDALSGAGALLDPWLVDSFSRLGLGEPDSRNPQRAIQELLLQLLLSVGSRPEALEILQAFAQVGIFTSPQEAVVDIDQDQLDPNHPPTFTIWSGEAFAWGEDGIIDGQSWNSTWILDVAGDPDFRQNRWSSGPQGDIRIGTNGVPSTTWTLPEEAWVPLSTGTDFYYRLTTVDGSGGKLRSSTHYAQEAMPLPPGHAVIRTSEGGSCSSTGSTPFSMATVLIGALLGLRRRMVGAAPTES